MAIHLLNKDGDWTYVNDVNDLGDVLKKARKDAGMSQSQLARGAGVTIRSITHWETGTRKMSLESAERVFRALGELLVIG